MGSFIQLYACSLMHSCICQLRRAFSSRKRQENTSLKSYSLQLDSWWLLRYSFLYNFMIWEGLQICGLLTTKPNVLQAQLCNLA
ncbi:hypothetical protein FGO68_gene11972 [Halteria grandinella]|uniref:Uncharacterized protein n=1 Tax=Halteria grandinella TaxID=5974 RepID=A0A8J8NGE7_HALGN|nr:hypothetical protein FGO68_gene11972 [Halteria grandinella]